MTVWPGQHDMQLFWLTMLGGVRAAQLRFTEHETRQLLAAAGIALPEHTAAMLHQRTEG